MSRNIKASVIVSAVLAVLIILSALVTAKSAASPSGMSAVKKLVSACENKSESKIEKCFSNNSMSFSGCVTTEDYLKKCGLGFDYMYDESCTTEKVYIIGSGSSLSAAEISELNYASYSNFEAAVAYIGADYTDAEGISHSTAKSVYVLSDAKSGKIHYIY